MTSPNYSPYMPSSIPPMSDVGGFSSSYALQPALLFPPLPSYPQTSQQQSLVADLAARGGRHRSGGIEENVQSHVIGRKDVTTKKDVISQDYRMLPQTIKQQGENDNNNIKEDNMENNNMETNSKQNTIKSNRIQYSINHIKDGSLLKENSGKIGEEQTNEKIMKNAGRPVAKGKTDPPSNLPPPWEFNVKRRRLLADLSRERKLEKSQDGKIGCFQTFSYFNGNPIRSAPSASPVSCQAMCAGTNRCSHFSFRGPSCSLFSSPAGLLPDLRAVSGPRECQRTTTNGGAARQQLDIASLLFSPFSSLRRSSSSSSFRNVPSSLLLNPLTTASWISSASDILLRSAWEAAATLQNVLPSQKEIIEIDPVVVCHSEGMSCCVPAKADWRDNRPFITGDPTNPRCRAVLVSSKQLLCATSTYTGLHNCGVQVEERDHVKTYKHVMVTPESGATSTCRCTQR
eukprot:GHVS01051857.1.p1 GENE.GHVS01051857.1~~GHVS01051857.1.p1  ORF type:complete len:520 (-),score=116.69 GHVS01051857.1:751-2124(-)